MVFGRTLDGKVTRFGHTGYSYRNVFMIYDAATDSVWYPVGDGLRALGGKRQGASIEWLHRPEQTTWGAWRKKHPKTQALLGSRSFVAEHFPQ